VNDVTDIFANVRGPLVTRPWPFAPLLAATGLESLTAFARVAGLPYTTVNTAARMGLTDEQSDHWAVRFGMHPLQVWPNWLSWDDEVVA
jgi:acetyl-CoA acetyltransferase